MKEKKIKPAKKPKKSPAEFIWDDYPVDKLQGDRKAQEKKKARKNRYDFPEYYY
jgi:hypothetical protein